MTKPLPTSLYRWSALFAISIAIYGSYFAFDIIGPLAPVLSRQLRFSDAEIGLLQASYSIPNIVMLLLAGLVIDRFGAKKTMLAFGVVICAGVITTAITPRVAPMALGRLTFGFGAESLAMATHVAIARWFVHDELTFAFALRGSASRLGSLSAQTSPTWAPEAYAYWRWPLLIAVGLSFLCVAGTAMYWVLENRGEQRFELGPSQHDTRISLREMFAFNRSFWAIAALCVTFYACVFPFQTFGQKFLIDVHHVSPQRASMLIGMEPLFSLVLMPCFGYCVDRFGRRALFMMIGSLMLVPVFPLLAYTEVPPIFPLAMMGLGFSLVPAVLWMSIVFVVDRTHLGFASALVDACQQAGLVAANLAIGWSNDHWHAGPAHPSGYRAGMWMFTASALAAVAFAVILRRIETGSHAHGLETIVAGRARVAGSAQRSRVDARAIVRSAHFDD